MSAGRRQFIRNAALAGVALGLAPKAWPDSTGKPVRTAPSPMRALVLGGTGFIGPPMVEYLLERGHSVTLFNRGRTNTDLFPGVKKLIGDRNDDLRALDGGTWDAVFDNHATLPRWVRQTAELLRASVSRYLHVSTISVYAEPDFTLPEDRDLAEPLRLDENAPRGAACQHARGPGRKTGSRSSECLALTMMAELMGWSLEVLSEGLLPNKGRLSMQTAEISDPGCWRLFVSAVWPINQLSLI